MPCPSDDFLKQFVEARLEFAEEEQIEQHLEHCATCSQRLLELERIVSDPLFREIQAAKQHKDVDDTTQADESDSSEEHLPQSIADYKILGFLGRGGMGTVYRGLNPLLNREVAIKVVKSSRNFRKSALKRFRREMLAIGKLQHPNIVQALDAGVFENHPYLVLELLHGNDFSQHVKENGPLSVSEACEVVRQTALALQHAHEAGLVHRDIKPSNLWRMPNGTVKILDLGLARFPEHESETAVGCVVGSPGYLSPEQAQGNFADKQSDMYSLGCTFYYLLKGCPPQNGEIANCPGSIKPILRKMLACSPQNRYQSMSELLDVLQRRRKPRFGIIATGVAVLVLGLVFSIYHFHGRFVPNEIDSGNAFSAEQNLQKEQNQNTQENWLTTKEIAEYLSVSEKTVYRWISEKQMPAHKAGRLWRFKKSEVDHWMKSTKQNVNQKDHGN